MAEPLAVQDLCEHNWQYNKPAHASASVRICGTCHVIDGEDLMRTLNEYAQEYMAQLKQRPVSLLYAHSDGLTYSYVDQPAGVPDIARERALLRALLTHSLVQLDEHDDHPLLAINGQPFESAIPSDRP